MAGEGLQQLYVAVMNCRGHLVRPVCSQPYMYRLELKEHLYRYDIYIYMYIYIICFSIYTVYIRTILLNSTVLYVKNGPQNIPASACALWLQD